MTGSTKLPAQARPAWGLKMLVWRMKKTDHLASPSLLVLTVTTLNIQRTQQDIRSRTSVTLTSLLNHLPLPSPSFGDGISTRQ